MVKQSELEVMVCDLFVDAYRAGQSCGDLAYNAARGTRSRLIKELGDVYAELESESYHREQFEVELMKANKEIDNLREQIRSYESTIRKLTHCIDFDDIPDDGHEFSEQELPFPDVEDLAPASEVLGGDD